MKKRSILLLLIAAVIVLLVATNPNEGDLVNLAYYHRRTIKWDPHRLAFTDAGCDPAWLTSPYREPWKV
jgi:hypothetical protein